MSHLVFLLGSYYPDFSAVGYCAYQVQKCLVDDYDISVVAFRSGPDQRLEEMQEGIRIQRIETSYMRRRNNVQSRSGLCASGWSQLLRISGAVHRLLAPETVDRALVSAYLDRLNSMEPKPNTIVPLVFPFETVLAALAYKKANPEITVYPYLFDDFVESGSLHVLNIARRLKRPRHLRLERRMLEEADAVLSMHPLRQHLETNFEKPLLNKITFLEHPLLTRQQQSEHRTDDGVTRLCFTGSLIRKVREPGYLLDLLRELQPTTLTRADFFVMGNEAYKVRTKTLKGGVEIVNHGRVPKSQADAAVRYADILLNVGEAQGKQVSSKIFEYMSTGKPIIHLAYVKDDAVSRILAKYPLALCLVQDRRRLAENARLVSVFIVKNRHSFIPFTEVEAIYPEALPATTGEVLGALIKSNEFIPHPEKNDEKKL
jgi:hypothetical protein